MEGLWNTPVAGVSVAAALALVLALAGGAAAWRHLRRARRDAPVLPAAPEADPLTGLATRAAFDDALEEAVHRSDVESRPLAVLVLDLDAFRLVNEAYGHDTGDRTLAATAARLREAVPDALACTRVAGDEFALALWADRGDAQAVATRVLAALRRTQQVDGHDLALDASVGIALYPDHGTRPRLLVHASTAMRAVKRNGGGSHATFEPAMAVDMREQAELLRDLRGAVGARQLQLLYQPKIDARNLQVTAAEALLRWDHPRRGVVSPEVFIPLAEKHGLIGDIGRWVVEEATRQAGLWREQGLRMRVAVNLSSAQLRQDDVVDHLCAQLARHGVAPQRFTCEITESVAMEDTQLTRAAFERLRHAGVHVSIDDFGTGHSSLATLRTLPAAELKIDRAFVTDLETSPEARSIAGAIIQMAHRLNLRVVAEGVETRGQSDWLVGAGCDELQGYLFARPMAPRLLGVWASGENGPAPIGFRESLFRETAPQGLPPR